MNICEAVTFVLIAILGAVTLIGRHNQNCPTVAEKAQIIENSEHSLTIPVNTKTYNLVLESEELTRGLIGMK